MVQPTPRPLPPQWVELALDDDDVAATLRILSDTDVTWSRLYHVFEIIETDASSQLDGWSTSAERNLFAHTANNRLALSDDARHGHEKWKPPTQPTTLDQARTLRRTIAIGWLTAKVS